MPFIHKVFLNSEHSICPDTCSSEPIVLSKDAEAVATVYHWLRTLPKGLRWCIASKCFPGPYGIKVKTGHWYPYAKECCEQNLSIACVTRNNGKGLYPDPWSIWKHCRTLEHVRYLVYKKTWILNSDFNYMYDLLCPIVLKNIQEIPLLINETDDLSRKLIKDIFEGKVKTLG